jgi:4-carboxymuconolactone decarboxylase
VSDTSTNDPPAAYGRAAPHRERLRAFAPRLAELTDDVMYGEIWERRGLSQRERSLITIGALVALGREPQLRRHLIRAMDNGLTGDELAEIVTHLTFYTGWPAGISAAGIAAEVVEDRAAAD